MTVRGPIAADELGTTLPHEHITINTSHRAASAAGFRLLLDYTNVDAVTRALLRYRESGGRAIVEATPDGCGRSPKRLRELSDQIGLHIICVTGWYLLPDYPAEILDLAVAGRADRMVRELTLEIEGTGVRAGAIKVGCSAPIYPQELLTLTAAARAQAETGAALMVHITNIVWDGSKWAPTLEPTAHRVLDLAIREGADPAKICICHADGTYFDPARSLDLHASLLARGVFLSYDQFGKPPASELLPGLTPTPDHVRIDAILALTREKPEYFRQILLSHDVSTAAQLTGNGDRAYCHVMDSVRPELTRHGLSQEQLSGLFEANPRRLLEYSHLPRYAHRAPSSAWGDCAWYWHKARATDNADRDGFLYSPDASPLFRHRMVQESSSLQQQQVLTYSLVMFLEFTIWLELNPVYDACRLLATTGGHSFFPTDPDFREGALGILQDEAAHAALCHKLLRWIQSEQYLVDVAAGFGAANRLQAALPRGGRQRDLMKLLFVIVSETTITNALDRIPHDMRVQSRVRELFRHHADDERRHQEFFEGLFERLWPRLSPRERHDVALKLPNLVHAFLEPDRQAWSDVLRHIGFAEFERIVSESFDVSVRTDEVRRAAGPTLDLFERNGVFDDSKVRSAFVDSGLISA